MYKLLRKSHVWLFILRARGLPSDRDHERDGLDTPKIDLHTHAYPDFYRDATIAAGYSHGPDDIGYQPPWNVSIHLAFMKSVNISHAYLSISSPGTALYADQSRYNLNAQLTTQANNYLADVKATFPSQFSYLASLPLPSISDTLSEITRLSSLDSSQVPRGFILLSNTHSLYLGSPRLAPVWTALNAQSAIILIHPTSPCPSHLPPPELSGDARLPYLNPLLSSGYSPPILEFYFDTTRSVIDLLLSGTVEKYPNITWIVPHAGEALPSLLDRALRISVNLVSPTNASSNPLLDPSELRSFRPYNTSQIQALLQKHFYFDLSGFSVAHGARNILDWVGPDRLVYGSDVPFTKFPIAVQLWQEMRQALPGLVGWGRVKWVLRENAERLLLGRW